MKRFLLVCASLFAFYVLFAWAYDCCALWLMRHSPSCSATKIERVVKGGEGESVAIFGSSRALGNYAPSILSASSFNYGVDGMSLNEALILVDQYLRHNPSDSTVIINLARLSKKKRETPAMLEFPVFLTVMCLFFHYITVLPPRWSCRLFWVVAGQAVANRVATARARRRPSARHSAAS